MCVFSEMAHEGQDEKWQWQQLHSNPTKDHIHPFHSPQVSITLGLLQLVAVRFRPPALGMLTGWARAWTWPHAYTLWYVTRAGSICESLTPCTIFMAKHKHQSFFLFPSFFFLLQTICCSSLVPSKREHWQAIRLALTFGTEAYWSLLKHIRAAHWSIWRAIWTPRLTAG